MIPDTLLPLFLMVVGGLSVGSWFFQRSQVRCGGGGNGRGSKLLIDEANLEDANGNPVDRYIYMEVGGAGGNDCISQWQISLLCRGEVLYLELQDSGDGINLQNSHGHVIGTYPKENSYYQELLYRLKNNQTISAWVDEWGARRRYFCEIRMKLYEYPSQPEPVAQTPMADHNTVGEIRTNASVVFFPAKDLAAVCDFYTGTLHFAVFHQTPQSVIIDTGYGYLGFVAYEDNRPMASGVCISLNCASRNQVYRLYNRLKKTYPIEKPPARQANFPVYSFFMTDPSGYALELQFLE